MKKAKVIKKKSMTKRKSSSNTRRTISRSSSSVDKVLIDNFIALQRVMTNLSLKFDELSSQISRLLKLFEISAKTLAKTDSNQEEGKNNKEVIEKLNNLAEQNKTIARGLTLMHELDSQKRFSPSQQFPEQRRHIEEGKYQKLTSEEDEKKL